MGSALSGMWVVALGFLFFVSFYIFLILVGGFIEADAEGIWQETLLGRYEMKWDEVTEIQTDWRSTIVLLGDDKRLLFSGPNGWKGDEKEQMLQFIKTQIEAREIPQREAVGTILQMPKNTKVARNSRRPPLSP